MTITYIVNNIFKMTFIFLKCLIIDDFEGVNIPNLKHNNNNINMIIKIEISFFRLLSINLNIFFILLSL